MPEVQELAPHLQEIARALGNRVDPEAIEDELKRYLEYGVPLAQAKRDIVRNHGGTLRAGAKKLADAAAGDTGVDLLVKVLAIAPKDITVKGEQKTIYSGVVADDSAQAPFTAWKDHNLESGRTYAIGNVYVKQAYRGEGVEVNIGDFARISPSDVEIDVKAGPLPIARAGAPGVAGGVMKIKELRDGITSTTITARVLDAHEKTITSASGTRTLIEGELADETGKVVFTCWSKEKHGALVKPNAVLRITNAYVKAFRGVPNLNFGDNAAVESLDAKVLPGAADLAEPKLATIGEVERVGGGTGVLVEGVVLEVKKGSGLIQRCTQCNRVLQKRECRLHGKVDGTNDLRVKAVLDDGTGALTVFLPREVTERLLGKSLDQCLALAKEAMTMDVIQDELVEKLTARRLAVTGNATSDDFGVQVIGQDAWPAKPVDAKVEAEKLIQRLEEFLAPAGGVA